MDTIQIRDLIKDIKKPYQGVACSTYKTNHTLEMLEIMEHLVDRVDQLEAQQTANNIFTSLLPFSLFTRRIS